jgi:hypothetical protein
LLISSIHTTDNSIVDEIRSRTIVFLIVDMTKPIAKLVIFLLRRRGPLALVAYLLRALSNHALFLVIGTSTSLLQLILIRLLTRLLLPSPLLLTRLLRLGSPALFVSPTLCFRILCGLVLLVLIGQCGLLWLREAGGTIAARMDYQVTTAV